MSDGRLRSRISGGALLAVAGGLMFVAPSAVLIAHGAPRWLALAVGLLAFPALPVGWHALAERRRRRAAAAPAKKAGLTSWDRFALRLVAVAVVAVGGTYALARGGMWSALRHHALWFTSWTDPDPVADSEVLARVPASAESVIWVRPGQPEALLPVALSGTIELALAFSGTEQIIIARGSAEELDRVEQLSALGLDGKRLARASAPDGMRILATPGWRTAAGALPVGLAELLHRAPPAAAAIAAAIPTSKRYRGVRSFVAWGEVRDSGVTFEADVEAADLVAVGTVFGLAHKAAASDDCGNRAFGDATEPVIALDGLHVRASATLPLEAAREIPRCMTARGF